MSIREMMEYHGGMPPLVIGYTRRMEMACWLDNYYFRLNCGDPRRNRFVRRCPCCGMNEECVQLDIKENDRIKSPENKASMRLCEGCRLIYDELFPVRWGAGVPARQLAFDWLLPIMRRRLLKRRTF